MAHDVFVSYSSQDKPLSDAVCAALEGRGIRCWLAPRDVTPGQDWSDAIIDAISDCRVVLLVLSSASNQSEQVKREVQNAVSEAKPILPFRIEDVALSKHMRYFIGTPHWLDALTPPMERHLQRMAETVGGLLASLEEKGGDLPPALQPPPILAGIPLTAEVIAEAEHALAHYIGPLARVLAKRAARETDDLARFHQILADEIASPAEKFEFLRKLKR